MKIIYHNDNQSATEEVQNQRQLICDDCEKYDSNIDTCSECQCIISRKKYYLESSCPIGKW